MKNKRTHSMAALWCLGLMFALVATPAAAWDVNDSEQPGSVLVFHKFIRGTQNHLDGTHPITEIEISVTCPKGESCLSSGQTVRLMAHWVCPGNPATANYRCVETDFVIATTVNGTLYFNPENIGPSNTAVATAPCPMGYLIVWVVDNFNRPIKFDGLIGDAIIRTADPVTWEASKGYNALPIQAATDLGHLQPTDVDYEGDLDFDGSEYQAITGKIFGTVRYEVPPPPMGGMNAGHVETDLTLLTLDVKSNKFNHPTTVDFNFYNEFEVLRSTSTHFVCWTEVRLTQIYPGLTSSFGRKGLVESTRAVKEAVFGVNDDAGPVTVIGIIETREYFGTAVVRVLQRGHAYSLYHDGTPVATRFVP